VTLTTTTYADAATLLADAVVAERAAQVGKVVAISMICDTYQVDRDAVFEGMETHVTPGNDGSDSVGEFVALEVAGILGVSVDSAWNLIATVLNLRSRFPQTWALVCEGRVPVWLASKISLTACHLTLDAALRLDGLLVPGLLGSPAGRVLRSLDGWIATADPTTAAERDTDRSHDQNLWVSGIEAGHCQVHGLLTAADGIALDHALDAIADTLPADQPKPVRRALALGELARGAFGQNILPTHQLIIHIPADDPALALTNEAETGDGHTEGAHTTGSGVARIEKWGPLLTARLPEFLAGSRVIVRPILDPATIGPSDAYETPDRMRFALTQRNPVCISPYGTKPARSCDIDHTTPYIPGDPGQTRLSNLGPLSRYTHRAKTHGGWQLEQPEPGVFWWRSPLGREYIVTATGTTPLGICHETPRALSHLPVGIPGGTDRRGRWPVEPPGDSYDRPDDPPPDSPHWDQPPNPITAALEWIQPILHPAHLALA